MEKPTPAWHKKEDLFLVPPGGWVLVGTVLAAVALAGGRPLWAQGLVTLGIGLLWIVWPPSRTPSKGILWILLALALTPLLSYLPESWATSPAWREQLGQIRAITTSAVLTPQPWFTLHVWMLWLAGVALVAWCSCQTWDRYHRTTLAKMFTGGMVVITAYALFAFSTTGSPEWWISSDGFGPFANRNQWGSLLGLSGVMALALAHRAWRHENKRSVLYWSAALALFTWAVLQNGSRGGVVVLVAGGFSYWMFFGLARKQYRYAAIAISFLMISFALFAMGGGALLERFVGLRAAAEAGFEGDVRLEFYRMTRNMLNDAPLTGFGLGNFEFILPFYLDYEPLFNRRPVHPESSFLWLAVEGGWLLVFVTGAAFCMLLWAGYKSRRSRATTIRCGAMACGFVLLMNSFFEVSGHRIGVLFPAIVLASLALPAAGDPVVGSTLRMVGLRGLGMILGLAGLLWVLTAWSRPMLPEVQGTLALTDRAAQAMAKSDHEAAIPLLEYAARLQPLNWNIHWTLAEAWLATGNQDEAWQEFRASSALLPYLDWLIEKEGYLWLPISPSRAAYAWTESLRRTPPGPRRTQNYIGFLRAAADYPALTNILLRLYADQPEFEFARLQAQGPSASWRMDRLLEMTNNLALLPEHLVEPVMSFFLRHGRGAQVAQLAEGSQRLKRLGWQVLSDRAARGGNLKEALDIYFQFGPRPALPATISRSDLRSIERAAALAPMDIATAIAYYQALEAARRRDDAFWQLRRIMDFPDAPPYIWFLAARTAHERDLHDEAWQFLQTFREKSRP